MIKKLNCKNYDYFISSDFEIFTVKNEQELQ